MNRELAGVIERALLATSQKTGLTFPRHIKPRNKKEGNSI